MRQTATADMADRQSGHLIVGLMVMVTVMMILLTAAAQSWTFLARRDNEAELIFRGEQYANAIAFYQKENGQYPLDLKVLMQRGPHRHRYIRRLWKDPVSKDGKWGKLYLSPSGKGFINPYASRRDQQAFVAGSFGDNGPGGDPFGQDDAGEDSSTSSGSRVKSKLGGGLTSRMNRGGKSAFGKNSQDDDPAGYSEPTPEGMDLRGGDATGLPIVGVVHRKKESGIKVYKNQAYLNDWAFTMLAEGQDLRMGGSIMPPKAPTRNFGMGDSHSPIYLKGDDKPGTGAPTQKPKDPMAEWRDRRQKQQQAYYEEERRRKAEAEAKRREEAGENDGDQADTTGDEDQDDPNDEAPADGDRDPNAPDPNAPADPNAPQGPHSGVLEAPSSLVL